MWLVTVWNFVAPVVISVGKSGPLINEDCFFCLHWKKGVSCFFHSNSRVVCVLLLPVVWHGSFLLTKEIAGIYWWFYLPIICGSIDFLNFLFEEESNPQRSWEKRWVKMLPFGCLQVLARDAALHCSKCQNLDGSSYCTVRQWAGDQFEFKTDSVKTGNLLSSTYRKLFLLYFFNNHTHLPDALDN